MEWLTWHVIYTIFRNLFRLPMASILAARSALIAADESADAADIYKGNVIGLE